MPPLVALGLLRHYTGRPVNDTKPKTAESIEREQKTKIYYQILIDREAEDRENVINRLP